MSTGTYDRIFDQATDHLDDLGWPPALIVERVLEFFDIHAIQAGQSRTTLETGIIPTPLVEGAVMMNNTETVKLYRPGLEAIEQLHQQSRQGGRARSLFCTLAVVLDNAGVLDALNAAVEAERRREPG